ncbi:MAG: PorT family protein, partial [Bacteroidales bacterium]|nr:PorT family protein [Bacteroidales bacterium]
MVSGIGFEINHYFFQGDNNVQRNAATGLIEERVLDPNIKLRKSKLNTVYLNLPLLLEAQVGKMASKERFYVSAGVVGGVKVTSKTKVVQEKDGAKHKTIQRGGDLNLNPFRLELTTRMGYKDYFDFYINYSLTPLFEKGKGPELFPVAVGFRIGI